MRQDNRDYYDAFVMPPAGILVERARRPPGTLAYKRLQRAQEGKGVAAAMDSWGEWRNWQERDDLGRFSDFINFKGDAKAWEPPPYYPYSWPQGREPQRGVSSEPYEFVGVPRLS